MTRKHFRELAQALRDFRKLDGGDTQLNIDSLCEDIADVCEKTNRNFDRNAFLGACGVLP